MICPKCENEIQVGHLICEKCGYEIRVVPDYDPDSEFTVENKGLSSDTMEVFHPDTEEIDLEDDPFEDSFSSLVHRKLRLFIVLTASIVILLTVLLIAFVHENSKTSLQNKAMSQAAHGNYEQAVQCITNAIERYPKDGDLKLLLADYLLKTDKKQDAMDLLYQVAIDEHTEQTIIAKAYTRLVDALEQEGRYQEINDLIMDCKDDSIVTSFQNYIANAPVFSIEEGVYDEVMSLKISSNTAGKIYYTLDGTKPDENSLVYTSPIFLQSGYYRISAIFINAHGIVSDVSKVKYQIKLSIPMAPEIDIESGTYSEPTMISVEAEDDCSIYYTTDNSLPTIDSVPYTGPIPMPLGTTNFKFIAINDKGGSSEVTMRSFTLTLPDAIRREEVVPRLLSVLVAKDYLSDLQGHKDNTNGSYSYQFSSVIRTVDGRDFYTIYEYFDDGTGIPLKTDTVFLMDIKLGHVGKLGYDSEGRFLAYPF